MAQTFSLSFYLVTINKRYKKDLVSLSDFYDGKDLLEEITKVMSSWKYNADDVTIEKDEDIEKVFRIAKESDGSDIFHLAGRYLSGILESGDYGSEEKLVDVTSGKETHTKTTQESLLRPFYFMFFIPKNSVYGFLILERISGYGVYTIITDHLLKCFESLKLDDLVLKFSPLVSEKANKKYRELIDYEAREVVLHQVRKEGIQLSKISGNAISDKMVSSVDLVYRAPIGKKIKIGNWLETLKKSRDEKNKLYGIESEGQFTDIDFTVDFNGKPKKISFNRIDSLGTVIDISDAVEKKLVRGYPPFKLIEKEANDIVSDLIKQFDIKP